MKKIGITAAALLAVVAVWAIFATAAFAADEFLVAGSAFPEGLSSEIEGHLVLSVLEGGVVLDQLTCALILDGTMTSKTIEITKWLNLAKEEIGAELLAPALDCTVSESAAGLADCLINTNAEVWPDNLPWVAAIELVGTEYILDVGNGAKKFGYDFTCETAFGNVSELCEALASFVLKNELNTAPPTVLAEGSAAAKLTCSGAGAGAGDVEKSDLDIWALSGATRLTTAVSN